MNDINTEVNIVEPNQYINRTYMNTGITLKQKYIILNVIKESGSGIVYLAYDNNYHKKVVIKELFPYGRAYREKSTNKLLFNKNENYISDYYCYRNEQDILNQIYSIQGVIRIIDSFTENNTIYIVTELIDGISMTDYLRTNNLSYSEIEMITKSLLMILSDIHNAGIIHRDICPDNIMISPNKSITIIDFGSSIDIKRRNASFLLESTYRNGFSPPEQYEKEGGIGSWMDIYALSATILYMFVNESLLLCYSESINRNTDQSDIFSLFTKKLNETFMNHSLNRKESIFVKKILENGLNANLAKRWKTTENMIKDLFK